jgi:hypothetical protein
MNRVVVIGSGLGGTIVSNELCRSSSITVLEIGPRNSFTYPEVRFARKHFGAVKTFCAGGGGTTNLWHNGLIPLNPDDICSRAFRWIARESKPYEDGAASRLFFTPRSYSAEYNSVVSEVKDAAERIAAFPDGIDCLIYPKKFKRLELSPDVEACYGVSDIGFVLGPNRLESVAYRVGSEQFSIKPDFVIFCAGALGTPYLVSKLLPREAGSLGEPGRGFIDHPMGFVGKIRVKRELSDLFVKLSLCDRGEYVFRTAVRVKSECGKYTCCAFFRPALTMQNSLSLYKYKSMLGASKGLARLRSVFSPKIFHPDILAEIYFHLLGLNLRSRIYNILIILEQKRGSNRVSYNDGRINVDWCISEEELRIYNGILKRLASMLRSVSDELNILDNLTEDWLWSAAHHSGTVPLGSSPHGLIDKDLKLNSYDNVFVCDGSVIQEHSYANTGLTIGQLALRLADRVSSIA